MKSLNISNFAVIRYMSVDFSRGLNTLTGETGAGKSIIVDALSMLLGSRSVTDVIRTGERVAMVEGIFELDEVSEQRVKSELDEVGVEIRGEDYLLIRREVHLGGRNRIFINDRSVTLATLKKLQPFLVEIHGQGEHRSLLLPQSQLLLLDDFAGCSQLRRQISAKYEQLRKLLESLKNMSRVRVERERYIDILRFQMDEIDLLNPQQGEEARLLEEKKLLTYAERRRELNAVAYQQLYECETSVLSGLGNVKRMLQSLVTIDDSFSQLLQTLEEATFSLSDVADTLRGYAGRIEYSPERLSEVEERLREFDRLKRKYGREITDLNDVRKDLAQQLEELTHWEELQSELLASLAMVKGEYQNLAGHLTLCRKSATPDFEKAVMEDLRHVAMENARFTVEIVTAKEDRQEIAESLFQQVPRTENAASSHKDVPAAWTSVGADHVEFYLSANVGEVSRPLQRVASGGELSRLMLTLRTICRGATQVQDEFTADTTLVFDEVDTGIGGRVAEVVGRRLKALAATQQVLCVTHLAQIARFADHHYAIAKRIEEGRTITQIKELSGEERVTEIARMLGASEEVMTARETSQWLLESAGKEPENVAALERREERGGRKRRK